MNTLEEKQTAMDRIQTADQAWEKIQNGTFIIAEIGKAFISTEEEQTVEEYLAAAKQLALAAHQAGASGVKFQTHNADDEQLDVDVVSEHFKASDRLSWTRRNTAATPLDRFWLPLKQYCQEQGIFMFSTPMSRGGARIVDQFGTELWKIGSADILDFVLLDYIRNTGKPVIISSGMSTLEEVRQAIQFLKEKNDRVALLHCVSQYPCPPEELQLNTMLLLREEFPDVPIGFSDHSLEIEPAVVAVAYGATVLEKHFSFSREAYGSDHKVSFLPEEFAQLTHDVQAIEHDEARKEQIRNNEDAQQYLGLKDKILQEGEKQFRPKFRKTLVAARDLPINTVLTPNDLYAMRPQFAGELPSERYPDVLGKRLATALKQYDPIPATLIDQEVNAQ